MLHYEEQGMDSVQFCQVPDVTLPWRCQGHRRRVLPTPGSVPSRLPAGEKLVWGAPTRRANPAVGGPVSSPPAWGHVPPAAASAPRGAASLINVVTQARCPEPLRTENCLLQSVDAAESPSESILLF